MAGLSSLSAFLPRAGIIFPILDFLLSDLQLVLERPYLEQERTRVRGGGAQKCAGAQLLNLMLQSALASARRSRQLIHHRLHRNRHRPHLRVLELQLLGGGPQR